MDNKTKTVLRRIGWGAAIVCCLVYGCDQLLSAFVCSNEIVSVSESPDHQLKAVLFHRECGATVGSNSQVSVISGLGFLSQDGGNVFIEDTGHNDQCSLKVALRWTGNRKLTIQHDSAARVFKSEKQIFAPALPPSVEVKYENY